MSFAEFKGAGSSGSVAIHYASVIAVQEVIGDSPVDTLRLVQIVVRAGNGTHAYVVKGTLEATLTKLAAARLSDINSFDPD